MKEEEYVRNIIRKIRPRAKFVKCLHSDDFIDKQAGLTNGFFYVTLYDEKIDSNVIRSRRGTILIDNTYLSSFAYNLFLCLLYCKDTNDEAGNKPLFKHNFKKFYAEQLYHSYNNIFARAILLETLLFEQQAMVKVFAEKTRNTTLGERATMGAGVMSNLVMFHEFGHFMLPEKPGLWPELLEEYKEVLQDLFTLVHKKYPTAFVTEFQCDMFSVISTFQQRNKEMGIIPCLRAISFAYWAFTVMSSLNKSAANTSREHRKTEDHVDLTSIVKMNRDYTYQLGIDKDFQERALLVTRFCEAMAEKNGCSLYGTDEFIPFDNKTGEQMLQYIEIIMENDDRNARDMSLLVAEAFHGHPEGIEFLYLRSKTFTNGQNEQLSDLYDK